MRTKQSVISMLFVVVAAACGEGRAPNPTAVLEGVPAARPAEEGPIDAQLPCGESVGDERLVCVARLEPAFAGVVVDDERLVVMLTSADRLESAVAALSLVLGAENVEPLLPARSAVAAHSWSALYEWKLAASALFAFDTVTGLDIDELDNRLEAGVVDFTEADEILEAAVNLGIPVGAFALRIVEPVIPATAHP